jgi:hypothetical protein
MASADHVQLDVGCMERDCDVSFPYLGKQMTNLKESVGYPYDWQNREEEEHIEAYWEMHKRTLLANPDTPDTSPWANGSIAIAAVVLGLIVMLLLSVAP